MKKFMRLAVATLLLVSMIFLLTGCTQEKSEGEFKVGMECDYPPFNWTQTTDANGAVPIQGSKEFAGGYDVEIAKQIAKALNKDLVIVKMDWNGLAPAVQAGTIDAIIAGMSPTKERQQSIDFSVPYYRSQLVMVVKKDGPYAEAKTLQDFAGAKITAQLNTFHYSVIDQIEGVEKQTAMDNFAAMRVSLESGTIDGYVSERPEAMSAAAANENFKMVEFMPEAGFVASDEDIAIAVGFKKGQDEQLKKINEAVDAITDENRVKIMDEAIKNQPVAQ